MRTRGQMQSVTAQMRACPVAAGVARALLAVHARRRREAHPRPLLTDLSKMMGGAYAGDWFCPNCDATVFASKNNCYKCQTPKPAGTGGGGAGGGYGANRPPCALAAHS